VNRRVLALGVLATVLATAVWYFFLISPRNDKIGELDDQLNTAIAEASALRIAVAALQDVQNNDVAFLAAIGQMEAGIPEEPELAVFIEEITALAEANGVLLQSFAPSEPAPSVDLPVYEISVSLAMEGEYFELLGFLFGLDDMERIVVVQSISITAGAGDGLVEEPEETTTTTSASTTTTTVGDGSSTSSTSSTTTSTTTTTTTTTTTIPALQNNVLSVAMTVKLFTRNPLLPIVVVATNTDEGTSDGIESDTEASEGGTFGQEEFGIGGTGQ